MAKGLVLFLLITSFLTASAGKNDRITVRNTSEGQVLTFTLGRYSFKNVETPWGQNKIIVAENATPLLEKGAPDLPKFHGSIVIDNHTDPILEIISTSFTDYSDVDIAPSKGNFTRDIKPSDVPYEKGRQYQVNEFWPKTPVISRDPYILRDLRGLTVLFQPFSYNPQTRVLRVYHTIEVRVRNTGKSSGINILESPVKPLEQEFHEIYKDHFLNYDSEKLLKTSSYPNLSENGRMLIICHGPFLQEMASFVSWKKQRGLKVDLVSTDTTGVTAVDIKNYVSSFYQDSGLTYLLLVGDHVQIPAAIDGFGNYSDNHYGYLSGTDYYPEVFVGRFSAELPSHVATQVNRTIYYEKTLNTNATWLGEAVGIASSEGPGDDNEFDFEHIRNIGQELTNFTYSTDHELFEGSQGGNDAPGNPTSSQLTTILNNGAGIINYTGHGASNSSVTTGFSSNHVMALDNMNKLPFFWSVACSNGEFMFGTCYAEHWLRSNKNGVPTGASAVLMATILQSWAPPMDGQDEMNFILTETYTNKIKRTFTGISMHGCMQMNDAYGTAGDEMASTWTTFGDPSLLVRTTTPSVMNVTHPGFKALGSSSLTVLSNTEGALVSITNNDVILGTGTISGGNVTINFPAINVIDTLLVTVTAFNKVTYTGTTIVSGGVGINTNQSDGFSFYPNPLKRGTPGHIQLPENTVANLTLTSAEGKLIYQETYKGSNSLTFPTDNLATGIYFLRVEQNGTVWTETVTIP